MLKLLSFSSCLPNRVHSIVVSAIRTGSSDSTAPLLRVLNSLTGFTRKSPNLGPRAFFCSNSSDGSEQVVEISVKGCDSDAESKSSSAIVPMNPRPEDYPTVGWLVAFKVLTFLFIEFSLDGWRVLYNNLFR